MDLKLALAKLSFKRASVRAEFYEDTAAARRDGLTLVEYLQKREARAPSMHDWHAPLYRIWLSRMDSGSFARAVEGFVPGTELMAISASENAAQLDKDLAHLAKLVRSLAAMGGTIWAASVTPVLIIVALCGLIAAFSFWFVPQLVSVIKPELWPPAGQRLLALANVTTNYGVLIAAVAVAAFAAVLWSMPRWVGPLRRRFDDWPPYSLYRAHTGSAMLSSLATLRKGGASLSTALEQLRNHGSPWTKWHANEMLARLDSAGDNPGHVYDTGFLPRRALYRVMDRAERVHLEESMHELSLEVMEALRKDVEKHAILFNRILFLFGGVLFAFLLIGFLETVYSVQDALKPR